MKLNMVSTHGTTADLMEGQQKKINADMRREAEDWAEKVQLAFENAAGLGLPDEIEKLYREIPEKRLNSPTNRSFFFKKIAEHILKTSGKVDKWETLENVIVRLALLAEITISVQYYHNYIFDSKANVNNPLAIRETLIKGNLLKSWAFRYVESAFSEGDFRKKVAAVVDDIFNDTDAGQYIEGRYGSYEAYIHQRTNEMIPQFYQEKRIDKAVIEQCVAMVRQDVSDLSEQQVSHLRSYFLRVYLVSPSLYRGYVTLLCDLLGCPKAEKNKLLQFAAWYGLMMQVVNDNWDFVPGYLGHGTKAKNPEDMQSDLRNKNMTLPLLLYLHLYPSETTIIKKYLNSLKQKKYSERREKLVFEAILPVLLQYALPIGKAIAAQAAATLRQDSILKPLLQIAEENRFYTIITEYHQSTLNHDKRQP